MTDPQISAIKDATSFLYDHATMHSESEDSCVKALCTLIRIQLQLITSILLLLDKEETIVGAAILSRSLIENEGTIRHISENPKRAKAYLQYSEEIIADLDAYVSTHKVRQTRHMWTTSKIEHRVALLAPGSIVAYDFLSNFTHGNNVFFYKGRC